MCRAIQLRTFQVLLLCGLILRDAGFVQGRKGIGDYEQEWGHITARPHVQMFWWLFFTTANVTSYTERPLVIWLQGGPGMSSSGYGNFLEIGPLDLKLQPRASSWVNHCNVLFVDSPVDVGFSYFSDSSKKYVQSNEEVGTDLVFFIEKFLNLFPKFRTVPIYIFGESYGGKMAVEFAYQLHKKIRKGKINANLQGIGLGGAYISPIDYVRCYAPMVYFLGLMDLRDSIRIVNLKLEIEKALKYKDYYFAAKLEVNLTKTLAEVTHGIDFYNFDRAFNSTSMPSLLLHEDETNHLMNTVVREALNISENVTWHFLNADVYNVLFTDLLKPVTSRVEALLNETDIKVIVYNGVFDIIVNTAGTAMWLENLWWKGRQEWAETLRKPLQVNMINEGYVKRVGKLVFYAILRAGHSVPIDNVVAMEEILKTELLGNT